MNDALPHKPGFAAFCNQFKGRPNNPRTTFDKAAAVSKSILQCLFFLFFLGDNGVSNCVLMGHFQGGSLILVKIRTKDPDYIHRGRRTELESSINDDLASDSRVNKERSYKFTLRFQDLLDVLGIRAPPPPGAASKEAATSRIFIFPTLVRIPNYY